MVQRCGLSFPLALSLVLASKAWAAAGPPTAPSNLVATAISSSRIDLAWTNNDAATLVDELEHIVASVAPSVTLKAYNGACTAPAVQAAGTANSFKTGALVVNDRADTWTSVPAGLNGLARLLTARDDRTAPPVARKYIVTVSGSCSINLPLDPRYGGAKLSWMDASWADSGLRCNSSASNGWMIWKKDLAAAGDLTLGCDELGVDGVCYVFAPGGSFAPLATVEPDVTSFSHPGLSTGTTHTYRVRAKDASGAVSAWSNEATATTGLSVVKRKKSDFNGDGRDDILLRHPSTGTAAEWIMPAGGGPNPGTGAPRGVCDPVRIGSDESSSSAHFQPVDWNGDGLLDLVQLAVGNATGWISLNRGTPTAPLLIHPDKWPSNLTETAPVNFGAVTDLWTCDFDGDGDLDHLLAAGSVAVLFNVGDRWNPGLWPGRSMVLPGSSQFPKDYLSTPEGLVRREISTLCAADVDGDGKPDVYVHPSTGGLLLHPNASQGGTFALHPALAVKDVAGMAVEAPRPYPVDLNGDGVLDLVSASQAGGVWFHRGVAGSRGAVFERAVPAVDQAGQPLTGGNDVAVVDWDGDGTLDLMLIEDSGRIRYHRQMLAGQAVFEGAPRTVRVSGIPRADQQMLLSYNRTFQGGWLSIWATHDAGCWWNRPWTSVLRSGWATSRFGFAQSRIVSNGSGQALSTDPAIVADFDADGNLDHLSYRPKEFALHLIRGTAQAPQAFSGAPVLLLSAPDFQTKGGLLAWAAADWDANGATDLMVLYGNGEAGLFRNSGTSQAPNFTLGEAFAVAGQNLKDLSALSAFDWDRDGRPDLVAGCKNVGLVWYRQAGGSAQVEAPRTIRQGLAPQSIACGDLDGDSVPDLFYRNYVWDWKGDKQLYLAHEEVWWLRGLAPDAPAHAMDLAVEQPGQNEARLGWTVPTGAARFEVRYLDEPVNEVNWPCGTVVLSAGTAGAPGSRQTATVGGLAPGKTYWMGVCMLSASGQRSAVSNSAAATTRPLVRLELAQGCPVPEWGGAAYQGCTTLTLQDTGSPLPGLHAVEWGGKQVGGVVQYEVTAWAGRTIERARLQLKLQALASYYNGGLINVPARGRPIRGAWDPATATLAKKNATAPWAPEDFGPGLPNLSPSVSEGYMEWDVTEALRWAIAQNQPLVLLLDHAPLTRSAEYTFHGTDAPNSLFRPRLTVEGREEAAP